MPQLITPPQMMIISTKDGEVKVTITLELNINLNTSGEATGNVSLKEAPKSKYEEINWEMPELTSGKKIEFGKKV